MGSLDKQVAVADKDAWDDLMDQRGPNDEIFSLHPAGANVVFCDGSVHMLKKEIEPNVLRKLVTRDEGIKVSPGEYQ